MNEIVKKAYDLLEENSIGEIFAIPQKNVINLHINIGKCEKYLPDLDVGEVCEINDVWDGEGEVPEESYSYKLNDIDWINYEFEILEAKENPLDTKIKITNIELI